LLLTKVYWGNSNQAARTDKVYQQNSALKSNTEKRIDKVKKNAEKLQ